MRGIINKRRDDGDGDNDAEKKKKKESTVNCNIVH